MKTITIGRDMNCDVYVDNRMISRRHAILRIHPTGKMELVDMSTNGTYVNGIRLSSNVPFPLKRKDIVSFAHVSQLDWKLIPNPFKWVRLGLIALAAIAVAIAVVMIVRSCGNDDSYNEEEYVEKGSGHSGGNHIKSDSLKNNNASPFENSRNDVKDPSNAPNAMDNDSGEAVNHSRELPKNTDSKNDTARAKNESVLDKVMRNTPSAKRQATDAAKNSKPIDKKTGTKKADDKKKTEDEKTDTKNSVPNQMI